MSIKNIGTESIHTLCAGQVIFTLSSVVKELVENSIDAEATEINIKLIETGNKLIEVSDNGKGIKKMNFENVCARHATSKITEFEDIQSKLSTLGFRGEALNSLCMLSDVQITTKNDECDHGYLLKFNKLGELTGEEPIARVTGTTVSCHNIFKNIPIRKKDFIKNMKSQLSQLLILIQQYAIIYHRIKFTIYNVITDRGQTKNVNLLMTQGSDNLLTNFYNIFGRKNIGNLLEFNITVEGEWQIKGYISDTNSGRRNKDLQFYYMNSRPIHVLKNVNKIINTIYREFNSRLYPVIIIDVLSDVKNIDINVTPDKREVFFTFENEMIEEIKIHLVKLLTPKSNNLVDTQIDQYFLKTNNLTDKRSNIQMEQKYQKELQYIKEEAEEEYSAYPNSFQDPKYSNYAHYPNYTNEITQQNEENANYHYNDNQEEMKKEVRSNFFNNKTTNINELKNEGINENKHTENVMSQNGITESENSLLYIKKNKHHETTVANMQNHQPFLNGHEYTKDEGQTICDIPNSQTINGMNSIHIIPQNDLYRTSKEKEDFKTTTYEYNVGNSAAQTDSTVFNERKLNGINSNTYYTNEVKEPIWTDTDTETDTDTYKGTYTSANYNYSDSNNNNNININNNYCNNNNINYNNHERYSYKETGKTNNNIQYEIINEENCYEYKLKYEPYNNINDSDNINNNTNNSSNNNNNNNMNMSSYNENRHINTVPIDYINKTNLQRHNEPHINTHTYNLHSTNNLHKGNENEFTKNRIHGQTEETTAYNNNNINNTINNNISYEYATDYKDTSNENVNAYEYQIETISIPNDERQTEAYEYKIETVSMKNDNGTTNGYEYKLEEIENKNQGIEYTEYQIEPTEKETVYEYTLETTTPPVYETKLQTIAEHKEISEIEVKKDKGKEKETGETIEEYSLEDLKENIKNSYVKILHMDINMYINREKLQEGYDYDQIHVVNLTNSRKIKDIVFHKTEKEEENKLNNFLCLTDDTEQNAYDNVFSNELSIQEGAKNKDNNYNNSMSGTSSGNTEDIDFNTIDENKKDLYFQSNLFEKLKICGQFNKGFIISKIDLQYFKKHTTKNEEEKKNETNERKNDYALFIIDQHAADEKSNFEKYNKTFTMNSQKLINKINLHLSPSQVQVIEKNKEIFVENGFEVSISEELINKRRKLDEPTNERDSNDTIISFDNTTKENSSKGNQLGSFTNDGLTNEEMWTETKISLTSLPVFNGRIFEVTDFMSLLHHLTEHPISYDKSKFEKYLKNKNMSNKKTDTWFNYNFPRPQKVWRILASKACRNAVMVGKVLNIYDMIKIKKKLSHLKNPWNCPHGRPTIKYIINNIDVKNCFKNYYLKLYEEIENLVVTKNYEAYRYIFHNNTFFLIMSTKPLLGPLLKFQ